MGCCLTLAVVNPGAVNLHVGVSVWVCVLCSQGDRHPWFPPPQHPSPFTLFFLHHEFSLEIQPCFPCRLDFQASARVDFCFRIVPLKAKASCAAWLMCLHSLGPGRPLRPLLELRLGSTRVSHTCLRLVLRAFRVTSRLCSCSCLSLLICSFLSQALSGSDVTSSMKHP